MKHRIMEKLKSELSRWINFDELHGRRVPVAEEHPRVLEDDREDVLGSEEEETHLKGTTVSITTSTSV